MAQSFRIITKTYWVSKSLKISLIAFSVFLSLSCRAQEKDLSFLTGSCAFLDTTLEDNTGLLYKGDTSIFYSMSRRKADFMLWLGDNWYLDEIETRTVEGLWGKANRQRNAKVIQWVNNMHVPQYAIWDDHDFGPDQSSKHFPLKVESRKIFLDTWKDNPSYGEDNEGIYTSFGKEDVQFILLDDRWWRSKDKTWDYILFWKNRKKRMFGEKQMDWLKKTLLEDSSARFKIVVTGSQVLNPLAKGDCLVHFPVEYKELKDFIYDKRINGVIFLTGDRHYSEVIKLERKGQYPLYDITVSPFTSDTDLPRGREKHNRFRAGGFVVRTQNFARISINGVAEDRTLKVEFYDTKGRLLNEWSVKANEITNK